MSQPNELIKTIKAVLWAFLGIRKQKNHTEDTKLNPIHVILVGILLAVVFIFILIGLVNLAIKF